MSVSLTLPDLCIILCTVSLPLVLSCILYLLARSPSVSKILLADRELPLVPLAVSLSVSSIIAMMSEDILTFSSMLISSSVAMAIMPNLVLPVVYHMQVTSVYEYLELRYNSSLLRRVVSLCVLVTSQMFLVLMVSRLCDGIADSIGVSRVYPYIVMGASIAIPCSGVLAIVWSSLWQTIVVIAAIATLLSTNNSQSVITTMAMAAAMPDSDDIVHTMAPMAGQVILWSAIYGCHQAYTARYCSARSILQARLAIGISIVVTMVLSVGAMLAGMVIRDMLGHSLVREQSEEDSEELETGLAGVIVSAVAAAVISTFSSVTLSLAASVWEDFLYQSR